MIHFLEQLTTVQLAIVCATAVAITATIATTVCTVAAKR